MSLAQYKLFKKTADDDKDRGLLNAHKAGLTGALAGLLLGKGAPAAAGAGRLATGIAALRSTRTRRIVSGYVAGQAAVHGTRLVTAGTKDAYGDRSRAAKHAEKVPMWAGLAGAGLLAKKRLTGKLFVRRGEPITFSVMSEIRSVAKKKGFQQGAALAGGITAADVVTHAALPGQEQTRTQAAGRGLVQGALYGSVLAGSEPVLARVLKRARFAARGRAVLFSREQIINDKWVKINPLAAASGEQQGYKPRIDANGQYVRGSGGKIKLDPHNVGVSHAQVLRSAYNQGVTINRYGGRAGRLGKDAVGAFRGEKKVDERGRPMKREWEKSWFRNAAGAALIDTALGVQGGGGSTADDISALACNLEVTWDTAGVIASTARLPVTIWNDVNKGDEGTTEYSNPPYPAPNNVVTAYPLITGLTGGGATDLDGQATIGGAKTAGHEAHLYLSGIASAWRLCIRAGETENAAAGRVIPDDDSTLLWEQIEVAAMLAVVDAAARLALTTAEVRNGDHVREIGRPEIVRLTCVGNTHTAAHTVPATTWMIDWICTPDTAGDMAGTDFYMWRESTAEYVIFWFKVGGAGSAPDWGTEGDGVHYHEIVIAVDDSASTVATAFKTALDAEMSAEISTTRTDDTIRMAWVTAGSYPDTGGNDTTWFEGSIIEAGADEYEAPASDSLAGRMLTLQAATVAIASTSTPAIAFPKTVGFSVAGNVGDIPVTIPSAVQTASEIAALVQAAVHAHARFHATVSGAEVIVTNAENGMVNTLAATGDTGFAVTVMQSGSTGALTYELIDRTQMASAAGWRELPYFVGFSAVSKPYAQNVADLTARRLLTVAQAPLGGKVITGSPYGAWIVVNAALLSPDGSTPGSDAAFGPNLLAPFTGETRMGYDYAEWDTHFQFDPLTSKFHCKVPGKYLLGVQVDMTQAASGNWRYIVQVRKNGTLVKRLVDSMSTGYQAQADLNLNCSPLILALVVGDVVDVWGYVVGGSAIAYWDSSARAFYNVTRLGP
jgi:hypothetical protein